MKKFVIVLNLMLFVLLFVGCNEKNNENDDKKYDNPYFIYEMALKEGFTGTYEEWLELIEGVDGTSIIDVEINEDGELIITMSDEEKINLGNIKGESGIGIEKIELLKSEGLVDTYIIYYTDGTTSLYTVTNGEDGKDGVDGEDGEDGEKGDSGSQGEQGTPGKSAYEIYLEQNPDYNKSEEEWIEDLVNGNLGKKHIVTFDSKGGSSVDSQIINHNKKIVQPDNPKRIGYTFLGWYVGDEKWSFIGYSVTENITLEAKWKEVEGFSVDPINANYFVGESIRLFCTRTNEDLMNKAIRWTSTNEDVATITSYGEATFIGEGKVTFIATVEGTDVQVASEEITVTRPALEVILIEGSTKIEVGGSTILKAVPYPTYADSSVVWSVNNSNLATINPETGEITGLKAGVVIVAAISKINTDIYATFEIEIIGDETFYDPVNVVITGPKECYVGYQIKLSATVYPLNANQNVVWRSYHESVLTIDEDGYCTGLSAGTATIVAMSTVDSTVYGYYDITVKEDENNQVSVDMQGYEIIIMNSESVLSDIDPFLDGYTAYDKEAKKAAWNAVEAKYNCEITVKAYPSSAAWGTSRINYINNAVSSGAATADIYTISSGWLKGFVETGSALDVTDYYEEYGRNQMDNVLKQAGSVNGNIYVASTGISKVSSAVDLGLFYDYDRVISLGLDDPAQMFNDGDWTYTNFEIWATELQSKLKSGEYALGGHSLYYWVGLTNAAGVKITDSLSLDINIDSTKSKMAMQMMNRLVNDGVVNPVADWAEGGTSANNGFQNKKVVMTTGHLGFITNSNRWKDMWGVGSTNIAYVPFPYPDSLSKNSTRISKSAVDSVLMYAKGRNNKYNSGMTAEHVYMAVNEMFLDTGDRLDQDPSFDAETELRNYFDGFFNNQSSIEAAMYYNFSRTFYDATFSVYSSIASSPFNAATKNIMYNNADYQNTMDSKYEEFLTAVYSKYA